MFTEDELHFLLAGLEWLKESAPGIAEVRKADIEDLELKIEGLIKDGKLDNITGD
jgi:hypothetical protein